MKFQRLITSGIFTSPFQTVIGGLIQIDVATDIVQFAHMFLQIEIPAESLVTHAARIGLLIVVGVHVEGEIVHLMEGLVANVTLVGLLAAVSEFVILVVALLMEAFTAEFTDEGFVARMDAGVGIQGG